MIHDRIEREIVIHSSAERVFAVLTQPEHIAAWFAFDGAEVDLRPGGAMVLRWREHGVFHGRVEVVELPRRFAFTWALVADEPPRPGNATLVEFTLEPVGASTRLRVVETGFSGLDGSDRDRATHLANNTQGWSGAFEQLAAYLA